MKVRIQRHVTKTYEPKVRLGAQAYQTILRFVTPSMEGLSNGHIVESWIDETLEMAIANLVNTKTGR